ncbi:hypothetical protein [Borreliella turdi]|uniref:hypothetical protein n=1 Tax=Borreliella turdi TaxID=57863 RepID=UPI0016571334|nr:hypothetical protein [Borreliella turdi]
MNFILEKIDDCEFICRIKRCANFRKILTKISKDYKEIFISKLERRVANLSKVIEVVGSSIAVGSSDVNVKGGKASVKQPKN